MGKSFKSTPTWLQLLAIVGGIAVVGVVARAVNPSSFKKVPCTNC